MTPILNEVYESDIDGFVTLAEAFFALMPAPDSERRAVGALSVVRSGFERVVEAQRAAARPNYGMQPSAQEARRR